MTNEKRNRIVAAVTVNVILLIAILAAVVVYQIVKIKIVSHNRDSLKSQIERLREDTKIKEDSLEWWQSEEGLVDLAYEFGFGHVHGN